MTNLLVDSHTFLWASSDDPRLPSAVRIALEDRANQAFLSTASIWELAIKYASGRLLLPGEFRSFILEQSLRLTLEHLPVAAPHALAAAALPMHHRDPFDRILVAQAQVEGMVLVTRDAQIRGRYDVQTLW